jgi:5-methylcytosine-specific restriction endonuclease McrA
MSKGASRIRGQGRGDRRRRDEHVAPCIPASDSSTRSSTRNSNDDIGFLVETSPEAVTREKEKARTLRKSQWWQRKLAKGECYYCNRKVAPADLTMDHLVPLVRGGLSTRGNVVPACKTCNNRKRYLLPTEWEGYLRGLDHPAFPEDSRG